MGSEVFKDPGFILKFVECLLIIALVLSWMLGCHNSVDMELIQHLAIIFICANFYFFFPAFIMMIMYAATSFSDNIYELIIAIFGAIISLLTAVFFLVWYYDSDHRSVQTQIDYAWKYREAIRNDSSDRSSDDPEIGVICVAVFSLLLMIVYIIDAVINGLQKK